MRTHVVEAVIENGGRRGVGKAVAVAEVESAGVKGGVVEGSVLCEVGEGVTGVVRPEAGILCKCLMVIG